MAQYVFKLPDIGEGLAEAEIVAWHVAVGDTVGEDQPLVDLMTEKATVEIPSPVAGRVVQIKGTPGDRLPIGTPLAVFETDAAKATAEQESRAPAAQATVVELPRKQPEPPAKPVVPTSPAAPSASPRTDGAQRVAAFASRTQGEKPIASPAVRRRAWEIGVPLQFVPGTGPGGRIRHSDLEGYVASGGVHARVPSPAPERAPAEGDAVEDVRIVGLRRVIAERLQDAQRRIPHFSYIEEVDVTELEALRAHLNSEPRDRPKLTLLPFLMRALVRGLARHPDINARFDDDAGVLHRYAAVHVGIATQTQAGLLVPVVRHAEARGLWHAAAEVARLADAARTGLAQREELSGSTITITSLGKLGGLAATPVINAPEVAIVGVNRIAERPIVRNGAVVIRKMMNLSSSFDHRIVDGWEAAEFIQAVKALLEQPAVLFIESA